MRVRVIKGTKGQPDRFIADYVGPDRKRHQVEKVSFLAAELEILHNAGKLTPKTQLTCQAVGLWWLDTQEKQVEHMSKLRSVIKRQFIGYLGRPAEGERRDGVDERGNRLIASLTKADISALRTHIAQQDEIGDRSVRSYMETIQQMLDAAVERGCIRFNPNHTLLRKLKRIPRKVVQFPPQSVIEDLRTDAPFHRLTTLDLETEIGATLDEVGEIRWPDIDPAWRNVTITRQVVGRTGRVVPLIRPQRIRTLPINDRLRGTLIRKRFMDLRSGAVHRDDRVAGQAVAGDTIRRLMFDRGIVRGRDHEMRLGPKQRAARAGRVSGEPEKKPLAAYAPSCLRHIYALRLIAQGANIKQLQKAMGFADAETVESWYGFALRQRDSAVHVGRVSAAIAALLRGSLEIDGDDPVK